MSLRGGSPESRCVNCSYPFDGLDGAKNDGEIKEIFFRGDQPFLGRAGLGDHIHVVSAKVGNILSTIFKLNYIPDEPGNPCQGQNSLMNLHLDDISVCLKCSVVLTELWKVYNEFVKLGEHNSYLSRKIAQLDEIIRKQYPTGSNTAIESADKEVDNFIQLRQDIFYNDDNESELSAGPNMETDDILTITPVSAPVESLRRGRIPVTVQEPTLLPESLLPSPLSDLFAERDDNHVVEQDDELWGRLAVTPDIRYDQSEVDGNLQDNSNLMLPPPPPPGSEMNDDEIHASSSSESCRPVSHSIFSSYRPVLSQRPLGLSSPPPIMPPPAGGSAINGNNSKSNRRKSSVLTRECTDAIEFVPGRQPDKSLQSMFTGPTSLQPRILARKRKFLVKRNSQVDSNEFSTFQIFGTLQSVEVMQSLVNTETTDQTTTFATPKIRKISSSSKEKLLKKKLKKKGSKNDKKSVPIRVLTDPVPEQVQSTHSIDIIPELALGMETAIQLDSLPHQASSSLGGTGLSTVNFGTGSGTSVVTNHTDNFDVESEENFPAFRIFKAATTMNNGQSPDRGSKFRISVSNGNSDNDHSDATDIMNFTSSPVAPQLPLTEKEAAVSAIMQSLLESSSKITNATNIAHNAIEVAPLIVVNSEPTVVCTEAVTAPNHVETSPEIINGASEDMVEPENSTVSKKNIKMKSKHLRVLRKDPSKIKLKKKKKKGKAEISDGNLHTRYRLRKLRVPFPCWYCDKDFQNASDVVEHTNEEHNANPSKSIVCEECAKISNSPQAYKYHAKTCLPKKPKLQIVKKVTLGQGINLKEKCPICFKFFLKKSLPTHLKITHSNERPYPCGFCEYKAKTTYRLKVHKQKVHKKVSATVKTPEGIIKEIQLKPWEPIPEGTLKIETSQPPPRAPRIERPFPCDACPYKGITENGLQAHKKKFHGEGKELVKCMECNRTFVDKHILHEHMRTSHDTEGASYRKKLRTPRNSTSFVPIPQYYEPVGASHSPKSRTNGMRSEDSEGSAGDLDIVELARPEISNNGLYENPNNLLNNETAGNPFVSENVDSSNPGRSETTKTIETSGGKKSESHKKFKNPGVSKAPMKSDNSKKSKKFGNVKKLSKGKHFDKVKKSEITKKYTKSKKPKMLKKPAKSDTLNKSVTLGNSKNAINTGTNQTVENSENQKTLQNCLNSNTSPADSSSGRTKSQAITNGKNSKIPSKIPAVTKVSRSSKSSNSSRRTSKVETSQLPERNGTTEEAGLEKDPVQKQFHCKDCDTNFPSKYRLFKHKMAEHGFTKTAKFFCDRCGKGFFTDESLQIHHDTIHGLRKAFVCQFCGNKFVKTSTMKNHMVHIHPNEVKPYLCTTCGVSFDEVSDLRDHAYHCVSVDGIEQPKNGQDNESTSIQEGEPST